jgi:energy-coupling factor transporter ATP-binding protein EcfA2
MVKPLPIAILKPNRSTNTKEFEKNGILLGDNVIWNPRELPNSHVVLIGASGSGKTQTLKAIAHELHKMYDSKLILIDLHGDQQIEDEVCYPINRASPYGINPLLLDTDPEGGGPKLQSINVTTVMKKLLALGPIQEGMLLQIIIECYHRKGIFEDEQSSWTKTPPDFSDLEKLINEKVEAGCKESHKLLLKLQVSFAHGIFSRPQPPLTEKLVRLDLSKLPSPLQAIAGDTLARQLLASHRLMGEITGKLSRCFLVIDEVKEFISSRSLERICQDGRKFGLSLIAASQSERHLSIEVIGNSATKIVLPVDSSECKKVARKFRFNEEVIASLQPLQALIRFGKDAQRVSIIPYFRRVSH